MLAACRLRRDVASRALGAAPLSAARPASTTAQAREIELVREGDVWALRQRGGPTLRLKHSKGLTYLARLLERPGGELHVCELAAAELRSGDAGPVLDARAKQDYRERLEQLRDELAESERFNDQARACRAREEIDALAAQLAAALGLGGRDRRAASDSERTRINVQRRLKNAIERIASGDAELGRYLARTIKTGSFCGYAPF